MIYLITGVPGAGKTLYAVSKLLQQLLAEKIKREDGSEIARRLCVDGIPNLVLPHEVMAGGDAELTGFSDKVVDTEKDVGHGLFNWWTWCKPGDVLVVDEVQRHWRPRGMGTKVPEPIARLETHRHYGVDFVLITQNPMLLDQNVRRLVGRHQHVRRLFGGARALIYEWDGCQTDTSRLKSGTRTLFTYPKNAYKLYHSSELHTKQRQKVPLWFGFPIVVLALGAFAGPKAYDTMTKSMTGKGIVSATPAASAASAPSRSASAQPATHSGSAAGVPATPSASAGRGSDVARPRKLGGCIAFGERCECFGDDGAKLETDPQTCQDGSQRATALPLEFGHGRVAATAPRSAERDCAWYVPMGATSPEVRCWDKSTAPSVSIAQSSLPPAQGTDGATMGPRGVGVVDPDIGNSPRARAVTNRAAR